jgi:hypothetical protein
MTEEEWQACEDVGAMFRFMWKTGKYRKSRLFAVAACRRVMHWMVDERSRNAIDISEQYADQQVGRKALSAARRDAFSASKLAEGQQETAGWSRDYHAAVIALHVCADHRSEESRMTVLSSAANAASLVEHVEGPEAARSERGYQYRMFRDIFGNPFRPVSFSDEWRTSDVILLARGIYAERAFDRMPILADALQDAGCDADNILTHLRDVTATHVRGCWALDLVLGKE